MTKTLRRLVLWGVVASMALAGCGGKARAVGGKKIGRLTADLVPAQVLDLTSGLENEKLSDSINDERRSYVDALGLYSFRRGELLQATLEISRFNKSARVNTSSFRNTILGQLAEGGKQPTPFRMSGHTVYVVPGPQQSVSIWFNARTMHVLTVRREYPQPRKLLRELLQVP